MLAASSVVAAPSLDTANPLGFFTNLASRLLSSQLNCDLTRIQIYPTNEYTSAVHRLLQVTANIYECTTTNLYPCIYRPFFTSDGTNIFISGYELVNGPDNEPTSAGFLTIPVDLPDPAVRAGMSNTISHINIYGVPWVIGAKKGFPNLNKLAVQNFCQLSRRIQITRPYTQSPIGSYNGYFWKAMVICGVSNTVAAQFWNSYQTNYPRAMYVQVDGVINASLTNDLGYNSGPMKFLLGPGATASTNISANQWRGTDIVLDGLGDQQIPTNASFVVPLLTNVVILPNAYALGSQLIGVGANPNADALWNVIPANNATPTNWGVMFTNNFRCMVFDGGPSGRIVDYVQISSTPLARSLGDEARKYNNKLHMWDTNYASGVNLWMPANSTQQGIIRQIFISLGYLITSDADWSDNGLPTGVARQNAIAAFNEFLDSPTVSSNRAFTPFFPTSKISITTTWEANDPLVHYLSSDMGETNRFYVVRPSFGMVELIYTNLWRLNDRYSPWGGNPYTIGGDPNAFNTAIKDPLVRSSDEWNFPTNQPLNFSWIGQVHRGTPWQTVYLKSADILRQDLRGWQNFVGSRDLDVAVKISPTKDWPLAALINSLINTNDPRQLFSVNTRDTNAWGTILNGFSVETNNPVQFSLSTLVVSSNSPAVGIISDGVNRTRANTSVTDGPVFPLQMFGSIGDILATPELSDASPFLLMQYYDEGGTETGLNSYSAGGITDEAMERIPTQLLPLLRMDSIGLPISSTNSFAVRFTGDDNYSYAVEVSSDLHTWTRISTNTPSNGTFDFVDSAPSLDSRFYRSVLLR